MAGLTNCNTGAENVEVAVIPSSDGVGRCMTVVLGLFLLLWIDGEVGAAKKAHTCPNVRGRGFNKNARRYQCRV